MFVVYDRKPHQPHARILQTIDGPQPYGYGKKLDERVMHWVFMPDAKVDIMRHYIEWRISERPTLKLIEDGNVVRGIPVGSDVQIWHDGACIAKATVEDGEIEFAPTMPGTYRLIVSCWPYLDLTMDLTR